MKQEGNILYAEEGMVLKRKNSNDVFGNEICLGKSYYIDGVLLETPHDDVADDFEEIPEDESQPLPAGEISDTEALNIITGKE